MPPIVPQSRVWSPRPVDLRESCYDLPVYVCSECGDSYPDSGFCGRDGTALAPVDDDPLLGRTLGAYRVAALLGSGGMGRVYKAVHPEIGSRVAIKVLSRDCADDPELIERFFVEARAVNLIRHENIVNIIDLAQLGDRRPYIVMEFLDGMPLSRWIQSRSVLGLRETTRICFDVLGALEAAHKKTVVHRDLKPDNIFLTPQGRAKVLDFGIAKLVDNQTVRGAQTREGSLLGTPHYMSPEQALAKPVDPRTDLYSMGVILFECLTGRPPFQAQSLFELLRAHVEEPPAPPRTLRPDIPPALERIVLKALAKRPEDRFQSAAELATAIANVHDSLPSETGVRTSPLVGRAIESAPTLPGTSTSSALFEPQPRGKEARSSTSAPTMFGKRPALVTVLAAFLLLGAAAVAALVWKTRSGAADSATPPVPSPALATHSAGVDAGKRAAVAPPQEPTTDPYPESDDPPLEVETIVPPHDSATPTETRTVELRSEPVTRTNPEPQQSDDDEPKDNQKPAASEPTPPIDLAADEPDEPEGPKEPATGSTQKADDAATFVPTVTALPDPLHYRPEHGLQKARKEVKEVMAEPRLAMWSMIGLGSDGTMDITHSQRVATVQFTTQERSEDDPCSFMVTAYNKQEITATTVLNPCLLVPVPMPRCQPTQIVGKVPELAPTYDAGIPANLTYLSVQGRPQWIFQQDAISLILPDDC